MAKASVAILLLALSVLFAGPVSARNKIQIGGSGRSLLDANASINQGGSASGNNAQVLSFGNSFADNTPFGSFSAAGGATAAISDNNGQPSISTSIGTGFSDSLFGQSQSQTSSSSSSNGVPGTSVFQNINVGSNFGGVGSQAGSTSGSQSGRRHLLDAAASINQGGSASGNNAQVLSFGNSFADNTPFGSFSAAGGATAAISDNNGQPSISTSIGTGFSDSLFGQSQSQTSSSSSSNGVPGTSVFQNINVGSNFGGVGSQAGSTSGSQSG